MSTQSKPAADIEVKLKSVKVKSHAQLIGKPQRAGPFVADTDTLFPDQGLAEPDINFSTTTTDMDLAPQDTNPFQTWQTDVKIFLLSTGENSSDRAEIRVGVGIEGYPIAEASTNLPLHTSWVTENGGLGHELAHQTRTGVGAVPLSFGGYVDENDTFREDVILSYNVDFTSPHWIRYADGGAWYLQSKNSSDAGYLANLWWQVTKLE